MVGERVSKHCLTLKQIGNSKEVAEYQVYFLMICNSNVYEKQIYPLSHKKRQAKGLFISPPRVLPPLENQASDT